VTSGVGDAGITTRSAAAWSGRWVGLRNRLLTSPKFQALATRLPLTRAIAKRRARALFDLCAGFVYSQILFACVRLDLFEALRAGPLPIDVLAGRLGLEAAAAARLLHAAAALDLVELLAAEQVALGELGAALLGNPGIVEMIEHHDRLYADLSDPVALLRGEAAPTQLSRFWPYGDTHRPSALGDCDTQSYSALMSASVSLIADDILAAYPFSSHQCLLDVGGGEGAFACAAAARVAGLRIQLVDLPSVAERARARFEGAGIAARARAFGADFLREPLPGGADLACLIRVVHDHDDETVSSLLANIHGALSSDGVLLIAEPMSGTRGAEAISDAYFGFYLLAMGHGRARTLAEFEQLLAKAGFGDVRRVPTRRPMLAGLLSARPIGRMCVSSS
jgi:demethylspheroidene O-methyltransferase